MKEHILRSAAAAIAASALITCIFTLVGCNERDLPVTGTTETPANTTPATPLPAPTDAMIDIEISADGCTARLSLPEGWYYETRTDESGASAIIKPTADAQGFIEVHCGKTPLGVCGTGLEQTQVDFNGHPATRGVFDGHDYWDFITLADPLSGCYIINSTGGEGWWNDCQPEIAAILDSIEFTRAS